MMVMIGVWAGVQCEVYWVGRLDGSNLHGMRLVDQIGAVGRTAPTQFSLPHCVWWVGSVELERLRPKFSSLRCA